MPALFTRENFGGSTITAQGTFRHLRSDRYLKKDHKRAVVMLNGFVENGYWYRIDVPGYSLADFVASLGFDVHVLSFVPNHSTLRQRTLVVDASFDEVVTTHLPRYHELLSMRYDSIHYLAHSYGVALLLSFLLGYHRPAFTSSREHFTPSPELAQRNQHKLTSVIALAAYLGFDSTALYEEIPLRVRRGLPQSNDDLVAQVTRLIEGVYRRGLHRVVPFIPSHRLDILRYMPGVQSLMALLRVLSPGVFPYTYLANTHMPAFHRALINGSSPETWETLLTVIGIAKNTTHDLPIESHALKNLSSDLQQLTTPLCFIQGERDLVTSPATIRKNGYAKVGSARKEFVALRDCGHQDIFTPKNPKLIRSYLRDWLNSF